MSDCAYPDFTWIPAEGCWSACHHCGRLAWEHEQADPLADMYATAHMWTTGTHPSYYPPAMKPTED